MKGAWSAVQGLEQRAKSLLKEVASVARPHAAQSRELVSVLMQPVRVEILSYPFDMSVRQATFYNGDRDEILIRRLAAYVTLFEKTGNAAFAEVLMGKTQEGFTWSNFSTWVTGSADIVYPIGIFDFLWNYEVGSRQSTYARGGEFASSDSLMGLIDRGDPMDVRTPIVIPRGEQITFSVKPLYFNFRRLQDAVAHSTAVTYDSIFVNFVGLGRRRAK